jgi:L,D-transpeptidase YbiS
MWPPALDEGELPIAEAPERRWQVGPRGAGRFVRDAFALLRRRRVALGLLAVLVPAGVFIVGTGYRYEQLPAGTTLLTAVPPSDPGKVTSEIRRLRRDNPKLLSQLRRIEPRTAYIVIDQSNNRLHFRRGDEVLHKAVCSSGSGMILRDQEGRREWVFDTPRGAFRVLSKTENPVWKKPDWAFIEEGKPIPRDPGERIEYGVLGEYALYFGNGYLIHGTLYERLLGRSVTHGCIRLGREDLRAVYAAAPVGTPIYIY